MTPTPAVWRTWRTTPQERQQRHDESRGDLGAQGQDAAVIRVEALLKAALRSKDGRVRALVEMLDELARTENLVHWLGLRLKELKAENCELRGAVCALRQRMQEHGCDIEPQNETVAAAVDAQETIPLVSSDQAAVFD